VNQSAHLLTRRNFVGLAGVGLAAAPAAFGTDAAFGADEEAPALKSELLFTIHAQVELPQQIGATPQGNRQIFYAKGGTFEGPKLKGKALAGGGDWLLVRPDGIAEVDVRATLQTDDGALIYTRYKGLIDSTTGYFRTTPRFETAAEKYSWLNKIIAVGVGRSEGGQVVYDVFQIL